MNDDYVAKINDFGLSKLLPGQDNKIITSTKNEEDDSSNHIVEMTKLVGTLRWMPPVYYLNNFVMFIKIIFIFLFLFLGNYNR